MSILPLIEACIKEKKIDKILITSITLSSGKILEKKFSQNTKVIHQFLPLDIPVLTKKFLEHWKPNLSIFIDSEIWPNLILNINKNKIPLFLINARITKKSFTRWKLIINFAKKIKYNFTLLEFITIFQLKKSKLSFIIISITYIFPPENEVNSYPNECCASIYVLPSGNANK